MPKTEPFRLSIRLLTSFRQTPPYFNEISTNITYVSQYCYNHLRPIEFSHGLDRLRNSAVSTTLDCNQSKPFRSPHGLTLKASIQHFGLLH